MLQEHLKRGTEAAARACLLAGGAACRAGREQGSTSVALSPGAVNCPPLPASALGAALLLAWHCSQAFPHAKAHNEHPHTSPLSHPRMLGKACISKPAHLAVKHPLLGSHVLIDAPLPLRLGLRAQGAQGRPGSAAPGGGARQPLGASAAPVACRLWQLGCAPCCSAPCAEPHWHECAADSSSPAHAALPLPLAPLPAALPGRASQRAARSKQ